MAVQQPTSDPQKPAFAAIPSPLLELLPDAGAFASNVRRSKFIGVFWALLLSLVCGGLFVLLDLDSAALRLDAPLADCAGVGAVADGFVVSSGVGRCRLYDCRSPQISSTPLHLPAGLWDNHLRLV